MRIFVINEATSIGYFGENEQAIGKYIETGAEKYQVIGVVKNVSLTQFATTGDIYVPYSTSVATLKNTSIHGEYGVLFLATSKADFLDIQEEYQEVIKQVELPKKYSIFISRATTYTDSFGVDTIGENFPINPLYLLVGIFAFLFMLLP